MQAVRPPGADLKYRKRRESETARRIAEGAMPGIQDFMSFEHYLTPSTIRAFYLLLMALITLLGAINVFAAFAAMAYSLPTGIAWLLCAVLGTATGLVAARVVAGVVMILFKSNEHLAALREHVEGR
jgi:hypothetical protein